MTGDSWRERRRALLAEDPAAAETAAARLLDDMGTEERDEEEIEAEHRASRLAAVRVYEPDARLDEELLLRLTGPDTEGGALRFQWGDALLNPVENAVSAAAGTPVQLELTGISAGSTVAHARPVIPAASSEEHTLDAPATSAASTGMHTLTRLLTALESDRTSRNGRGSSTRWKRWPAP
ncbi:hypothetical protein OG883_02110 [Streptomyces sp. NBC_01142]|uniref:hypothetical protein n=1 Tax=Streptomyces sp. NBC_01142 TaxID=2975865 RepID=UPI00225606F4|nr:hypothetical protein [Streptomyces sp. NBC_01142]MCX4818712.1 hypothetical protein [Streptomyces sp. NBC_01142]